MAGEVAGEVIPLGTRLRTRREELGLSQAQAARELDVARTAYRLWELEAARPAPDRWRAIAKWLGMSVTAMLLAGELIDQQEALEANEAAAAAGLTDDAWDTESAVSTGDYFSQERAMITRQAELGAISDAQAAGLRGMLERIQEFAATGDRSWHPGEYRKRLPSSPLTPGIARAALAATTVGVPAGVFEDAALLVSELVTNSVVHSGSGWVDVAIVVDTDALRVEVSDQGPEVIRPRTPDGDGNGWGMTLVAELARRWGVERRPEGKTVWFELDLA
jgi:anti-sigma regulatory factor (Ser/Thr protein kinase)/transcriptional regulator with XRE-family HTH domain